MADSTAEPDWRKQFSDDDRNKIIQKTVLVLKECVTDSATALSDDRILALAKQFEEAVYSSAVTQQQYLNDIAQKLYHLKTKNPLHTAGSTSTTVTSTSTNATFTATPREHDAQSDSEEDAEVTVSEPPFEIPEEIIQSEQIRDELEVLRQIDRHLASYIPGIPSFPPSLNDNVVASARAALKKRVEFLTTQQPDMVESQKLRLEELKKQKEEEKDEEDEEDGW